MPLQVIGLIEAKDLVGLVAVTEAMPGKTA